jgi:hypothetical protein
VTLPTKRYLRNFIEASGLLEIGAVQEIFIGLRSLVLVMRHHRDPIESIFGVVLIDTILDLALLVSSLARVEKRAILRLMGKLRRGKLDVNKVM